MKGENTRDSAENSHEVVIPFGTDTLKTPKHYSHYNKKNDANMKIKFLTTYIMPMAKLNNDKCCTN